MGTQFYGEKGTTQLSLELENPASLSFNFGNAHAVLGLLGLLTPPNEAQYGSCTMPEARRAILQARARFERKAPEYTREASDTKQPGRPRVLCGRLDEEGLRLRLDMFERFVNEMDLMGAERITWS